MEVVTSSKNKYIDRGDIFTLFIMVLFIFSFYSFASKESIKNELNMVNNTTKYSFLNAEKTQTESHVRSVILLLGLDIDDSEFSKGSYWATFNDSIEMQKQKFIPFQTLGIIREGNQVKIKKLDYLAIPTDNGFLYSSLAVSNIMNEKYKNSKNANDEINIHSTFEETYKKKSVIIAPRFFNSKAEIIQFVNEQNPHFSGAIKEKYEKISFITPNFYITEGFDSEVHGGATWFNANEIVSFYKLNITLTANSIQLNDYVSRPILNNIIIEALKSTYNDSSNDKEDLTDETEFPFWGGKIKDYREVYFTFQYQNNQINIIPFTLVPGNSSRYFMKKGNPIESAEIKNAFNIKERSKTVDGQVFISPENSTKIVIDNNRIFIYDMSTNKLILNEIMPKFNKIVMREWALDKYVNKWENEFY